jgi:two-component system response regulator
VREFDNIDVLLVEDNPSDAEMTMRAFRKAQTNRRLFWVKDGVEALEFIRCEGEYAARNPHDPLKVVLLDLKMPRLNGLDVLRELKSDSATSKLPVVIMTSSNHDRDISECYRLGGNGYVTKPVQVEAFSEAVAQVGRYWLDVNQSPAS